MLKRLFAHEPFIPAYMSIAIGLLLLLEPASNHSSRGYNAPKHLFDSMTPHPLRVWGVMYLVGGIVAIFPFAKFRATARYAPIIRVIAYAVGAFTYIGYGATLIVLAWQDPKVSAIGAVLYGGVGARFYFAAGKVGEDPTVWAEELDA